MGLQDIDVGNARELDTRGTGWFIGFGEWTRESAAGLRHVPRELPVTGVCMKWFHHEPGHESGPRPVSEGWTMSILVTDGAHFELDFSPHPDFPPASTRTVVFRHEGDYAIWGEGLHHRWRCITRVTICTLRFAPLPAGEQGEERAGTIRG